MSNQWWFRCLFLALAAAPLYAEQSRAFATPVDVEPPDGIHREGIQIQGALELSARAADGTLVTGLSALAWDQDEQRLYALSDRGSLLHLRPVFEDGTLVSAEFLSDHPLLDENGRKLRGDRADAEGLAIADADNGVRGDTRLWVSFERRPRILSYSTDGRWQETLEIPPEFRDIDAYRNPNNALESLVLHPDFGLMTAAERPMATDPPGTVFLRTLDGDSWRYTLSAAPRSSLVALEALPDGRLLALERAFVSPLLPLVISLRLIRIGQDGLDTRTLARLDTSMGWKLDNFEGIAHHRDDRFFMVSDDNTNPSQRTLLVYFSVPELSTE